MDVKWDWETESSLGLCFLKNQFLIPFVGRSDALQVCIVNSDTSFSYFTRFVPAYSITGHRQYRGVLCDPRKKGKLYLTSCTSTLKCAQKLTKILYEAISEVSEGGLYGEY